MFIGAVTEPAYLERCRAEAGASVHFLGLLPPQELADAYAAADVHVLASLVEQMGRVALEAGMAGCNLVMTQNSPARIFWRRVPLVRSRQSNDHSRRDACSPGRAAFEPARATFREQFTWARAAHVLAEAYHELQTRPALPLPDDYNKRLMEVIDLRAEAWTPRTALRGIGKTCSRTQRLDPRA